MTESEKRIKELAEIIEKRRLEARVTVGSLNEGVGMWYARDLYMKGYRKQSEVVKDVFERIVEKAKAAQASGYDGLGVEDLKQLAREEYGVVTWQEAKK